MMEALREEYRATITAVEGCIRRHKWLLHRVVGARRSRVEQELKTLEEERESLYFALHGIVKYLG